MARNPELEAEIAKSPDDVGPYQVYADWLIQQNDPLGELINVQIKRETDTSSALAEQEANLLAQHRATWFGDLADQKDGFSVTWKRGSLDSVVLGDDDSAEIVHGELYPKLRPLRIAERVRALRFAAFADDDGEPRWDSAVEAMLEYGVPATLRSLAFDRGSYWDISWTWLNKLEPLYQRIPGLERLEIKLGHMDLGTIVLPNLREFEVYTGGFTTANMQSVLGATWPKLERLVLRFGNQEDYGADCSAEDVVPLLSQSLPNLRHLAIGNSAFIDELIPQLAASPLLKQLRSLDLSLGMMTDAGANAIVENAAAFQHLAELDLHRNYLSEDAQAAVGKVCAKVLLHDMEDPDEDYRYCAIGE